MSVQLLLAHLEPRVGQSCRAMPMPAGAGAQNSTIHVNFMSEMPRESS